MQMAVEVLGDVHIVRNADEPDPRAVARVGRTRVIRRPTHDASRLGHQKRSKNYRAYRARVSVLGK